MTNHSTLGGDVIACDTQLLWIKNYQPPICLSVAIHAASGDVLAWDLGCRSGAYQSLLKAIHASRISGRHFDLRKPCYIVDIVDIVDIKQDTRRITQALKDIDIEVRFCNPAFHPQFAALERFFRNFDRYLLDGLRNDDGAEREAVPLTLAIVRKQSKYWLKIYQRRQPLRQSAAEGFSLRVPQPSPRKGSTNRK